MSDGGGTHAGQFLPTLLMWTAMTAVMMTPVVAPWVIALRRHASGEVLIPPFVGGYAVAWAGFSLGAAGIQVVISSLGVGGMDGIHHPGVAAAMCLLVGAYQLSPIKEACLDQCSSPAGFFLSRWRSGIRGAARMGAEHGLHCLGCCWGLMALALVVGAMHLGWMALLMALMLGEIFLPWGRNIARVSGWVLVALGCALLAQATTQLAQA